MNKELKQLLTLVAPYWRMMLLAAVIGAGTIGANIGLLATSAVLISAAALMPPILDLMPLIVGVRFFGISRAVLRYVERYYTHEITFRILQKIRVWFYREMEPLAPVNLKGKSSGELLNRIIGDVETLKFFYLRVLAAPIVAVIVLVTSGLFLAQFSPGTVAILVFFFLLGGVVLPLLVGRITRNIAKEQSEDKALFHTKLVDYIDGMSDLYSYGQEQSMIEELEELQDRLSKRRKKVAGLNNVTTVAVNFFSNIALLASLVVTIPLVTSGELRGIYLAMVVLAVWGSFEAILPLPASLEQLDTTLVAAHNLFNLTNQQIKLAPEGEIRTVDDYDIEINQLSFSYGSQGEMQLKDISLDIPSGSKVAIVGASGAGKSTITNLLLKFWPYEQGSITIGGQELRNIHHQAVRDLLGIVDQQPYLFNGTIRENILIANPDATEEAMVSACQQANIDEFIESLPQRYETYVGNNGYKLSGGQRQRIALSRALIKGSPVLILDEVTQGLDNKTRKSVLTSIAEEGKDKTVIQITHNLDGLEDMDQIIAMKQGKIVEKGTHQQLMEKRGYYYQLWKLEKDRL